MNSTYALREFAEIVWDTMNPVLKRDKTTEVNGIISTLTALISEHYYPKEFTEWLIAYCRWDGHCVTLYDDGKFVKEFYSTDDLIEYWKENEQ